MGVSDTFHALKASLSEGTINHAGVASLCEIARLRLETANIEGPFDWLMQRYADVFVDYFDSQIIIPTSNAAEERIRKAAIHLIFELERAGDYGYFSVTDDDLWTRVAGEEKRGELMHRGQWAPNRASLSLKEYLTALVEAVEERSANTKDYTSHMGQINNPKKRVALPTFVIRRIRVLVDETAERHGLAGSGWLHGRNKITATLASIVLDESIDEAKVDNALRGAPTLRRKYEIDR